MIEADDINLDGWTRASDTTRDELWRAAHVLYSGERRGRTVLLAKMWFGNTWIAGKGEWVWQVRCQGWYSRTVHDGPRLLDRIEIEVMALLQRLEDAR